MIPLMPTLSPPSSNSWLKYHDVSEKIFQLIGSQTSQQLKERMAKIQQIIQNINRELNTLTLQANFTYEPKHYLSHLIRDQEAILSEDFFPLNTLFTSLLSYFEPKQHSIILNKILDNRTFEDAFYEIAPHTKPIHPVSFEIDFTNPSPLLSDTLPQILRISWLDEHTASTDIFSSYTHSFSNIKQLEGNELHLNGCSDDFLELFAHSFPKLKILSWEESNLCIFSWQQLKTMEPLFSRIKSLNINGTFLHIIKIEKFFLLFSLFPRLQHLSIANCFLSVLSQKHFSALCSAMPPVRSLTLDKNWLNIVPPKHIELILQSCPDLKYLSINSVHLNNFPQESLNAFLQWVSTVQVLHMEENNIHSWTESKVEQFFSALSHLKKLYLGVLPLQLVQKISEILPNTTIISSP